MKPILYLILLFILFSSSGCSKDDFEDIPYTDFHSFGSICSIPTHSSESFVTVINNQEDYYKHVQCYEGYHPEIDFNHSTLLIAFLSSADINSGETYSDTHDVKDMPPVQIAKNPKDEYIFQINSYSGGSIWGYTFAVIIPKIRNDTKVTLKVK